MHEITKKLFNNKFLSDIQFSVDGKLIYAHSLELMKRSEVFVVQLDETCGESKLIPIVDCKYENFLEFLRYLYTDVCTINDDNGIDLLKLATKYKVIMLENRVINLLKSTEWSLQLFEHCIVDKYEIARRNSNEIFIVNSEAFLKNEKFLAIHPDAVNAVLQFDEVQQGVNEIQIFNALAGWIQNFCKHHKLSLTEGRQRFDGLISKIRFPLMSNDEIHNCVKTYPGLLSESDGMSIGKQIIFGSGGSNNLWISKQRIETNGFREWHTFNRDTSFESKFTVTKNTILYGLWIGSANNRKEIELKISAHDISTKQIDTIQFTQSVPDRWNQLVICLGDSLRMRPNFEYAITIKYLAITGEQINVVCRKKEVDLFYNNPENSIKTIQPSDNMIEMLFKLPSG